MLNRLERRVAEDLRRQRPLARPGQVVQADCHGPYSGCKTATVAGRSRVKVNVERSVLHQVGQGHVTDR